VRPFEFMLSPKRDLIAAKMFLRLALSAGGPPPQVINVDGHPAYPSAIAELKQSGELGRLCRCRTSPYLNNVIEQDHRFIKKRVTASLGFRSAESACKTIEGYEAMHAIRKGQIRWVAKGDPVGHVPKTFVCLSVFSVSRPGFGTPPRRESEPRKNRDQNDTRGIKISLVRGICGSLVRSNGGRKFGSRSRERIVFGVI
jgi:hypothetical protein